MQYYLLGTKSCKKTKKKHWCLPGDFCLVSDQCELKCILENVLHCRARSVASSPPHKLVGGVLQGSCHCSVAVVLRARGSLQHDCEHPKFAFGAPDNQMLCRHQVTSPRFRRALVASRFAVAAAVQTSVLLDSLARGTLNVDVRLSLASHGMNVAHNSVHRQAQAQTVPTFWVTVVHNIIMFFPYSRLTCRDGFCSWFCWPKVPIGLATNHARTPVVCSSERVSQMAVPYQRGARSWRWGGLIALSARSG